ncbi:twin-arginine translocation signal domain-containing protein [Natronorubrum sp. FCH18a]|uniref:twin-arginine translocation signal domain-containing protein n=1 Tax=Natronorubrum sp. FCH18a TaxID=3447018 RepID=UPI003F5193CE
MSNNSSPGVERRTFLKTAAVGSTAAIAGCVGGDSDDGELSDTIPSAQRRRYTRCSTTHCSPSSRNGWRRTTTSNW